MDANLLKNKIIEKGFVIEDIKLLCGIKDLNNPTIKESILMKSVLKLSDREAAYIFLGA